MGRNKRRTQFGDSMYGNTQAWRFYADRLTELSISMFEWKNLPDTVDERYLELILFRNGSSVFFKDEVLGFIALPWTNNGKLNIYGIPTKRRAYAVSGYQSAVLGEKNSVIVFNNMLHTNSILPVEYYARRLWDLDRTMDINARAQKTPVFLQGTEEQRLTLINLYQQYDGNQPVILGDKALNVDSAVKCVKTDAPFVADKIYQLKTQLWNEALTYLGISNVSFQKKERLISDEVSRSQGGTIASRYSRLESRRQAAEKINKMFGLEIEVDYRADFREQDDEFMLEQKEDGTMQLNPMVLDLRTRSSSPNASKLEGGSIHE